MKVFKVLFLAMVVMLIGVTMATAATTCVFIDDPAAMVRALQGDCTTDSSIVIPDGYTLDGNDFAITALDPANSHFQGAVVKNGGPLAGVVNLTLTTQNLVNACDVGDARLRGIMFDGASGIILGNTVTNINQGASGCQEGNAIEVRNGGCTTPLGSETNIEIAHNTISNWQKTGIVANCEVIADIHHNTVGGSSTQENLAANSIQVGFGATASVTNNHVAGNQWKGASNYAATSILLFGVGDGTLIQHNNLIEGNSDVGIYIYADGVTVDNNRVFESGDDGSHGDIGIGNYGKNDVTNNKVRGYETPYDGVDVGTTNKTIPSPHD